MCVPKKPVLLAQKNLGDDWKKSQSITYKTWMSLHLLSQIDADRWGVQQTLNCYFLLFQTIQKRNHFQKKIKMLLSGLPPLIVFSVALIIITGTSAFDNSEDEVIEQDRHQDDYALQPSYFIRTSIHPFKRYWMNRPPTFAGESISI
jgi:hypothetical protein